MRSTQNNVTELTALSLSNRDFRSLAHAHLPSTIDLLVSGGDDRIALDQCSHTNAYGCGPSPQDGVAAFGSSTASTISEAGFVAADILRARLLETAHENESQIYAREIHRIKIELTELCGLSDIKGLDLVLGASGTDMHLIAAQLVCHAQQTTPLVVMVDASETGSGVSAALEGRYFSGHTTLRQQVSAGAAIEDNQTLEVATVAVRDTAGMPRAAAAVDREVERLAQEACGSGRRVLLIVSDCTKTGLIAPSIECAAQLQRRMGGNIEIVVDACQFRIAATTLRAYLQNGISVILTGSKFVTGPAFSGALLMPATVAQRLREAPLQAPIRAHSRRADWPVDWPQAQTLNPSSNFGLLLRWQAALAELRTFRAIPDADVSEFLQLFARTIQSRLTSDPYLEPLPVPALDRSPLTSAPSWDQIPTIFPFALRRSSGTGPVDYLNHTETRQVYRWLQSDLANDNQTFVSRTSSGLSCQLGQPVVCGRRDGVSISVLRMCVSARLVVEGTANNGEHADEVIARALSVLDRTVWLAGNGWSEGSRDIAALA